MADNIVIYVKVHQPRRLRLPAQPVPIDASMDVLEQAIFDDTLNRYYLRKVSRTCYHPMADLLSEVLERGLHLCLGFSFSFLYQARAWDTSVLEKYRALVNHPNVELVCVEPYHSFLPYLDIVKFQERMAWARDELGLLFGKRPNFAEVTEMFMARDIAAALEQAGFAGALTESREGMPGYQSPAYPYNNGKKLKLFCRHKDLSDDVGYRFSQKTWSEYPLTAPKYVESVKGTSGDVIFVGWDFETFGEHHSRETGIFDFLRWLPGELNWRGVQMLTLTEAVEKLGNSARRMDLPVNPTTWAGINGDPRFFFGSPAQFKIFQLMHHAYSVARLTRDPRVIDMALWLCQSDNLHLLGWSGDADSSEAEVSSYFTPGYWWNLGASRIPAELEGVYNLFIAAASRRLREQAGTAAQDEGKTVEFKLYAPAARAVALVGDMTGWKSNPLPLNPGGEGYWKASVQLSPGKYQYKFLVDGQWRCDPESPVLTADGFGSANSVIQVN